jgi:hypothetical protein
MESKHESPNGTSPGTYTETYRGFTLTLEWRSRPHVCRPNDGTPLGECFTCLQGGEVRAVAREAVTWFTPWGRGWARQLEAGRRLVDRYVNARESCERHQHRRELAAQARTAGAGTVDLPTARPAVRS